MGKTNSDFFKKPLRIAAIQFAQRPEDVMKVPALLEQGSFNAEQLLHAVGNEGYGLYRKEMHYDLIKKYIADCSRRGIGIILYANAHMLEPEMFKAHPDWMQVKLDGHGVPAYGTYSFACVNSPWRDWFFQRIRESLEQDIRGIFLDGPLFIAEGCHCRHCQELFQNEFGHPIDKATRSELSSFKSEHIGRFVRDVRNVIRESGKDVALYANCLGLVENITGCTVDAVSPYVDLIGSEGGFLFYGDPNEVSIWHGSETAKYLESKAKGRPYVIFNAGNHQPWAREMHTVPETMILYGSTVANGANVWYGVHGLIDSFHTPGGEAAFQFNRFLKDNEPYYTGTEQVANVALLFSHRTIDTFPDEVAETDFTRAAKNSEPHAAGSFQKEFHGISDMLFRAHCQFTILDEGCLSDGSLQKYRALILPNTCCLSDADLLEIRRFVENGGCLIATLESGMYDENGVKREHSPLQDVLGIRSVDGMEQCEPGCGYMRFEGDEPIVRGGSGPAEGSGYLAAGFTTGTMRCTYSDDVEVLASSFYPMKGRYNSFNEKNYPSITMRRCGRGTAVYIAGGIGQTYREYGIPEMKAAMTSLVEKLAPGDLRVENAFPTVEVEMRRRPGGEDRLIHFVNHTGYMRRPIEKLIPCTGISVSLKTQKPVKRIHSLFHPQEIPFRQDGEYVRFFVDVTDYELVAVEVRE